MSGDPDREVQLGYIAGVHGVKGWVKVHSYTDPRDNVVAHRHWTLRQDGNVRQVAVTGGQAHGKTVIAGIAGVEDRDTAAGLVGAGIFVPRSALPECGGDEYYWADLEGITVRDRNGNELGRVLRLIETGAHDVLVLDGPGERLIPFVLGDVVTSVDLDSRTLTVTWDASYWDD